MTQALSRIDSYCDTVPRAAADVERIGPFTLFVGRPGNSYYARPAHRFAVRTPPVEFDLVRVRQRELRVPESFEWVHEMNPELADDATEAGLVVRRLPLMMRSRGLDPPTPVGYSIRLVPADDPALPAVLAAIGLGFRHPGTAVGAVGTVPRDEVDAGRESTRATRQAIEGGLFVLAAAEGSAGPVAGGSHHPRGSVAEITGVATLPVHRRRGLGAALTVALCRDAEARGVRLCFLSAGSDDIARVYRQAGFARVGTACLAEPVPQHVAGQPRDESPHQSSGGPWRARAGRARPDLAPAGPSA